MRIKPNASSNVTVLREYNLFIASIQQGLPACSRYGCYTQHLLVFGNTALIKIDKVSFPLELTLDSEKEAR